jgi:ribose transport system permease protein
LRRSNPELGKMIAMKKYKTRLETLQSLIALFIMIAVFSVLREDFRDVDNFWTIMRQVSVNTCLSVGMTMVILTGGIDLSVGSVLALSGAVAAGLLRNGIEIPSLNLFVGVTVLGSLVIAIVVGSALGLFNV